MTTIITIYGLEDPRNGIIRYVGQTTDVYARFVQHLRAEKVEEPKDAWILELKSLNLMVIMRSLETLTSKQIADNREAYWIHHYQYLAVKSNVGFFNKHFPVTRIPDEQEMRKTYKMLDETELQARLQTIPDWARKLDILEEMIGGDRAEIYRALFGRAPGGRNNADLANQYEILTEAIRWRYRQARQREA